MDTQNIDTEGDLMTVNEIAAFLKVPRSWVYSRTRMAPENGFPVFKLGRYCRFSKDKVTRWLNEKAATVK